MGVGNEKEPEAIVLFDGVCAVCDTTVMFVIDRDPDARIAFAPLQSDKGAELMEKYHVTTGLDSMVLIKNNRSYTHSTAVLRTMAMYVIYILIYYIYNLYT